MKNIWKIWVCSIILLASGCSFTLGPKVETRYVIVVPGLPVEILQNRKMPCRILKDEGGIVQQDIGGWIAMPPEHWQSVKELIERLKVKNGGE